MQPESVFRPIATETQPFRVEIPQERLDDLRTRLERSELAPDFGNEEWRYGVERGYLAALVDHWREGFDWRAHEAAMNRFVHRRVTIDGLPVHFLHLPGRGPAPMPLILTHGWPWTFWDFSKVIEPLADPARFGGDAGDAFDIVVPSLPGYVFSTPLERTGITPATIAGLWVRLMSDVLDFARFGAHGGDWGLRVNTILGHAHADRLIGIHMSGAPLAALTTDRPWPTPST